MMWSRKRMNLTNASSRSIEGFFSVSNEKVDGGEAVQKKRKEAGSWRWSGKWDEKNYLLCLLHTFWLYCLLYYRRFPLLCIKRDTPCQLQINCHFHFLDFPTVSSLLHIRKILVHWPFLEISGPQKWVVGATLALKQNFLAGTLSTMQKDKSQSTEGNAKGWIDLPVRNTVSFTNCNQTQPLFVGILAEHCPPSCGRQKCLGWAIHDLAFPAF